MSDIKYNTMRFGTDEFNPYIRQALLVSNAPIDLSNFNRLDYFTIQGQEPQGSQRRFMFKVDNKVYKFSGQELVEYSGSVTLDNVLNNGNTAAQVEAVKNNSALAGKKIYPIIALYAENQDAPTARIVATASVSHETLDLKDEHTRMNFREPDVDELVKGKILGFNWDIDITGDAAAGFKVKILPEIGGTWSDYLTLTEAKGQTAVSVIPKWYYHVDAVNGNNSVKIKYFYVYWSPDFDAKVYGDDAFIFSNVKNFGLPLTACVLVVRHHDLDGGSISADVSFQKKRKSVSGEVLGFKYSGIYQTAYKFVPASLKVYVNGYEATDFKIQADNQHFYVAESKWGASPPYSVSVDYSCDADDEIWLPMTPDAAQPTDNDLYTSRFFLKNPYDSSKHIAAIRIKLSRGGATKSATKTATGSEQRVKFYHYPDSISCDADTWDFDYDTNEIVFTSAADSDVNISYSWHGKTPVVTGWSAALIC